MMGAMTRKYMAMATPTTTTTATMPESQNGRPASLSSEYVISAPSMTNEPWAKFTTRDVR